MHHKGRFQNALFSTSLRPDNATLAIMVLLLFLIFLFLVLTLTAQPAQAQTFKVIYNFTGGADGFGPLGGLSIDADGNLYGMTYESDYGSGPGTVFKLSYASSRWFYALPSSFQGTFAGLPYARVVFGPDGNLYGTTAAGGGGEGCGGVGCGTVFKLVQPAMACSTARCSWTITVLHTFEGGSDGAAPFSELTFDQAGHIYGTTSKGGAGLCYEGCGTVYELSPSGGGWTERIIYSFTGGSDGEYPIAGVIFDTTGNLYGTTFQGGDRGNVYRLTPSGSGWTEDVLYRFHGGSDGFGPYGGLVFDTSSNLYGSTFYGGSRGGGTIFELSPSGSGWIFSLLYSLSGYYGPEGSLIMDATGNLYGAAHEGAYGFGDVFKLSFGPHGWTYSLLYEFFGTGDGAAPTGSLAFDANDNLYGTTQAGGQYGGGVVFEITPN